MFNVLDTNYLYKDEDIELILKLRVGKTPCAEIGPFYLYITNDNNIFAWINASNIEQGYENYLLTSSSDFSNKLSSALNSILQSSQTKNCFVAMPINNGCHWITLLINYKPLEQMAKFVVLDSSYQNLLQYPYDYLNLSNIIKNSLNLCESPELSTEIVKIHHLQKGAACGACTIENIIVNCGLENKVNLPEIDPSNVITKPIDQSIRKAHFDMIFNNETFLTLAANEIRGEEKLFTEKKDGFNYLINEFINSYKKYKICNSTSSQTAMIDELKHNLNLLYIEPTTNKFNAIQFIKYNCLEKEDYSLLISLENEFPYDLIGKDAA